MKLTLEQIHDIAEDLRGTCQDINEEKFGELDSGDLAEIDSLVFECEQCGWWCGTDEMSSDIDQVCDECRESDE